MSFNTEELYVLRSHLALGQTPTQADLEAAAEFSNIRAFARDLVAGNTQSNEDFVSSLYENLLDRTPDAEEVQWWAEQMDQGLRSLTKAQILLAFQDAAASEEGGVANAKVEALGLESIDLEFGSTGPVDPIDPIDPVEFNINIADASSAQNNTWSIGREAIDAGQATLSNQYTISLKNQLNDAGLTPVAGNNPEEVYNAYFLSPLLSNIQSSTTQSELVLEVIDRHAATNEQALEFMAVQSFNFFYNDENIVVSSEAILNASTYEELRDAIEAALAADGRGDEFTVRLGNTFERQQTNPDTQEFTGELLQGTQIIIEATGDGEMVRGGFETGAKPNANQNIDPAARMTADAEQTVSTTLISTNIELQNIGYGSQGAGLNVSGQSESNKAIQEFKIDAQAHSLDSLGVWLKSLSSNPFRDQNHQGLERVELTGSAPYFHVGNQDGEKVVRGNDAGIVDVREFAAGNFAGNIQLDATITSNIIERDFNLVDTDNNPARDNTPAEYNLGRGDDRLLIDVAVEALAHEDFALNINTGAGNDYVHLRLTGDSANQLANHQDLNNITIEARSGNNTIWTEGDGNARIVTGGGRDTIYTDNSARQENVNIGGQTKDVNAHWVLNAQDTNINNLRGVELTPALLLKSQLTVTFSTDNANGFENGFESTVTIPTAANGVGDQRHVNQAIKKAINEDAVLSKLLVAKDGPNNTLIIESLIDGVMTADNLSIEIEPATWDDLSTNERNLVRDFLRAQNQDSTNPAAATEANVNAALEAGVNGFGDSIDTPLANQGTFTPAELNQYTVDFDGVVAVAADDITVAGVTVTLAAGDDAEAIAGKVFAELDGQANLGGQTVESVTVSGSQVVVTFAEAAAAAGNVTVADATPGILFDATVENTIASTTTPHDGAGQEQETTLDFADRVVVTAGNITIAGQTVALTAGMDADAIAGAIRTQLGATVTIDGETVTVGGTGSEVTFTGPDDSTAFTAPTVTWGDVELVDVDAANATDVADLVDETQEWVAADGTLSPIQGADSGANTDNVINAGAGNDVIVLSHSDNAFETIEITGTNNGHNTIVNFQVTTDSLDFSAYLTTRNEAEGSNSTVSRTLVEQGVSNTIDANQVTILTFTSLLDQENARDNELFANLTAARLRDALNDDERDFGGLNGVNFGEIGDKQYVGDSYKAVVMVENDQNLGEYKAFELTVRLNRDDEPEVQTANLIGTYDFGETLTGFDVGNLA